MTPYCQSSRKKEYVVGDNCWVWSMCDLLRHVNATLTSFLEWLSTRSLSLPVYRYTASHSLLHWKLRRRKSFAATTSKQFWMYTVRWRVWEARQAAIIPLNIMSAGERATSQTAMTKTVDIPTKFTPPLLQRDRHITTAIALSTTICDCHALRDIIIYWSKTCYLQRLSSDQYAYKKTPKYICAYRQVQDFSTSIRQFNGTAMFNLYKLVTVWCITSVYILFNVLYCNFKAWMYLDLRSWGR